MATGAALRIDSSATTPRDQSADLEVLKVRSLIGQRDTLIKALVQVFTWLNGGVYLLTFVAWAYTAYAGKYEIVTEKVLMSLIAATVVQAGIAFVAMTRFLFPSQDGANEG